MKQLGLWIFLMIIAQGLYSQVTISGELLDAADSPVIGASIMINKVGTEDIIAYDISDDEGMYSISFSTTEKEIDIQVHNMGFGTVTKTISNHSQTQNFQLSETSVELKEIIVKSSPITQRGDTINYYTDSFAKEQDRSIADVLKRIPGIEVLNDGKILYQGKPINKYYIEGLDLLEGKYNLANENLPHKEVVKVQILENHQPLKVLDSLQFSDKAALNIKLKNTYTLTGQAKLGAGLSPLLWDANVTPLLFTKKQQMLVSYQSNNTGDNIASQLKSLTIEDLLEQFENNSEKQDWLGIQQLGTPDFSEKRWLDNNVHLLTGNHLRKLKNDYEIRLNASYLNDYQQQNGSTRTLFFIPTDTISLLESKYNQLFSNSLETNLTVQKNANENYLKNSLQFQGFWDKQRGNIHINDESLSQNLSNRYFKLSNKLKTIFPVGRQLMTLNSYVGLSKMPQNLDVNPGQFQDLLNKGDAYEKLFQSVDLQTLYTNNSVGFTKGWKEFSFSPKIGLQFEKQNLESRISTSDNKNLSNEFTNNLDWTRSKFYLDLRTQYRKNKYQIELTTLANFHSYQIEDRALEKSQNLNRLTFEPRLSIVYEANAFWKFASSASFNNQFGMINQLHYAYILQNYRNIQRINTPLPQISNQSFSGRISYRNPMKSLFWNIAYRQTQRRNNLLYQTKILENGATELLFIEQDDNKTDHHNISTRASKYFSKLKTNAALKANFGFQDFQQILNSEITDIKNQNWGFGGNVEIEFTDWFNTEYRANWLFSKNRIQEQSNNIITQQSHLLNLNFHLKKSQYLAVKTEYIKNDLLTKNTQNFFADILYRYAWKKKNIDFELEWTNIFNTKTYRTVNINTFSYVETNFRLRPSQVLLKVRFSL